LICGWSGSPIFSKGTKKQHVWPLNVFAPWPRINYASRAIKCLPFGAENCAIGVRPWLLPLLLVVVERSREEPRSPPHKRKDLAAGAERASSQLSCDYLSSRMDARMDHVGYVTPRKKVPAPPPVPFAPIINLIINCAACLRA
jgi:hypothetical protein